MARQGAIESWRKRALEAEEELASAVALFQAVLDTNRSYEKWNVDRMEAMRRYK